MQFNISYFIFLSIICSVLILMIKVITPLLDKKIKRTWRYFAWIIIGIRLLVPFDLSMNNMRVDLKQTNIAKNYVATSSSSSGKLSNSNPSSNNLTSNSSTENGSTKDDSINKGSTVNKLSGQQSHDNVYKNQNLISTTTDNMIEDVGANSIKLEDKKEYNISNIIWGIWASGTMIMMMYNLCLYFMMKKKLKKSSQVMEDIDIRAQLRTVRKTLGVNKVIDFRSTNMVDSPLVMGCRKPVLYLTNDNYSEEDLYYILAHELTHVKKHHAVTKFIFAMINSLYWFNPFVYIMTKEMSKDMEILCDDGVAEVIGSEHRKSYCEVILKCVTIKSRHNILFSSSFGGKKNQIKERLIHIMNSKKKTKGIILAISIFIAITCFTLVISFGGKNSVTATGKKNSTKELNALEQRVNNIMAKAIVAGAKELEQAQGDKFIATVPFKEDYDFKVYESSAIQYAIGVCNKEESPIKDLEISYSYKANSSGQNIKSIVFQQYEDYTVKSAYMLENIDQFVALEDGKVIIVMNSYNNSDIDRAMENFKLGEAGLSYFEDVINRKSQLAPLLGNNYISVRIWRDNRKHVEYISLSHEEKNAILGDTTEVPNLGRDIMAVIDGKIIKTNETVLRMASERCGYKPYKVEDLGNFNDIKEIKMTRYCDYMTNVYISSDKIEEVTKDEASVKEIVTALVEGCTSVGSGGNELLCNTLIEFTRLDGTKLTLPMVQMELETEAYMGNFRYSVSSECLSKLGEYFPKIVQNKTIISGIDINEKIIDKNTGLYLGMPRQLAEEFIFRQGIYNPWTVEITNHPSALDWGDIDCSLENIGFTFTSKDENQSLYSISVNDSSILTKAGLKVGDDKATMERLYGTKYEIRKNQYLPESQFYVYQFNENTFTVNIKDNKVESWSINKDIYKHKRENRPSYIGEWEATRIVKNQSGITMEQLNQAKINSGNTLFFLESSISVYDKDYSKLHYPSNRLTYGESTISSTEFENTNGISLKSLGITSHQLKSVKVDYLYNETPMTIVMDTTQNDKAFLLMNGDCIELSRIKYE